mgnify:CR=1 FL=1
MKFLTGKDYPWLCESCQAQVDLAATVLEEGEDTNDEEAPCNWAYDNALFCSQTGKDCLKSRQEELTA